MCYTASLQVINSLSCHIILHEVNWNWYIEVQCLARHSRDRVSLVWWQSWSTWYPLKRCGGTDQHSICCITLPSCDVQDRQKEHTAVCLAKWYMRGWVHWLRKPTWCALKSAVALQQYTLIWHITFMALNKTNHVQLKQTLWWETPGKGGCCWHSLINDSYNG